MGRRTTTVVSAAWVARTASAPGASHPRDPTCAAADRKCRDKSCRTVSDLGYGARPEARVVVVGHSGVFDKLIGRDMGNCELIEDDLSKWK